MSELRRRHTKFKSADTFEVDWESEIKSSNETNENPTLKNEPQSDIPPESFWLTRVVFLRYLGFIYFIAFLISFNQNKELIGSHGLTPASNFLLNVGQRFEDAWSRMVRCPACCGWPTLTMMTWTVSWTASPSPGASSPSWSPSLGRLT